MLVAADLCQLVSGSQAEGSLLSSPLTGLWEQQDWQALGVYSASGFQSFLCHEEPKGA